MKFQVMELSCKVEGKNFSRESKLMNKENIAFNNQMT